MTMNPRMTATLLIALCCASCTIHPLSYNSQTGDFTSMGASALTKTASEGAYAYTPSGQPMGYFIQGKDEMGLPRAYFIEKGITSVAGTVLNGYRTAQSTERILSGHAVQRSGIRAARDVRLAEIAVPEVVPEVPVAAAANALP